MYVIYLDEVKYHPPKQQFHWLCGLAFSAETLLNVEARMSQLAEGYFGTKLLNKDTEFHAKEIVHGTGPHKGREVRERISLLKGLLSIIHEQREHLKKIEVRINPSLIRYPRDIADQAFMFFVEKCDSLMQSLGTVGILIADSDPQKITANVHNLSFFRTHSTSYEFSRKIERLVDTIHHTQSHHSRLLQLADVYAYSQALCAVKQEKYFQRTVKDFIKSEAPSILVPDRRKDWPTENSVWLSPKVGNS